MEGSDIKWIWVLSSIILCQITSLCLSGKLNHLSWSLNLSFYYIYVAFLLLLAAGGWIFLGKISVRLHSFKKIVCMNLMLSCQNIKCVLQLRSGLKQAPGNNWLWHADKKNKRSSHEYYCPFHRFWGSSKSQEVLCTFWKFSGGAVGGAVAPAAPSGPGLKVDQKPIFH